MRPPLLGPSLLLWSVLGTWTALAADSGTNSPVQSAARPFGLEIAGPVKLAGSDAAASAFQAEALPGLSALVQTRLSEQGPINDSTLLLDPSKLILSTAADVRVYFVGEGAGYHNSLGFNTAGGGVTSGNPLLIFPDASSRVSTYNASTQGSVTRTGAEPLLAGDFVDLGNFAAGTKLDFFLIANGASGGNQVFSTDGSVNPDGINHVVSFAALSGSYLLIGFEDLFEGGDRDFNDVLFAVDIGARNLATLTAAHEPATVAILAAFLGVGGWVFRRRTTSPGGSTSPELRPG